MYGVSQSYVSSLRRGAKTPYISFNEPIDFKNIQLTIDRTVLQKLLLELKCDNFITNDVLVKYLNQKLQEHLIEAKIIQLILDNLKGE